MRGVGPRRMTSPKYSGWRKDLVWGNRRLYPSSVFCSANPRAVVAATVIAARIFRFCKRDPRCEVRGASWEMADRRWSWKLGDGRWEIGAGRWESGRILLS